MHYLISSKVKGHPILKHDTSDQAISLGATVNAKMQLLLQPSQHTSTLESCLWSSTCKPKVCSSFLMCQSLDERNKHCIEKNSVGWFLDSELPLQKTNLTRGSLQKEETSGLPHMLWHTHTLGHYGHQSTRVRDKQNLKKRAKMTYWGLQILPGDGRTISQDAPDLCPASVLMLRVQSQAVEEPGDADCRGVMPCPHEGVHLRPQVRIWEGSFIFSL